MEIKAPIFLDIFECEFDVLREFDLRANELRYDKILVAAYEHQSYDGQAWVVYERYGILFEVHGSHCSCHGLEGQWDPEETTLEAIHMREAGAHPGLEEFKAAYPRTGLTLSTTDDSPPPCETCGRS